MRHKRYVLSVLTSVFTLNWLDRGLIILLLQPIKLDLALSDTQLGFLTGIAFALFYATVGVPMARWADRGNRVTITSIAVGLWGVTMMSCVFVTSFLQLVVARIAAAIGEAGCMPPTYSLLGDYFPGAAERTRAMSVYWLASPLALLLSMVIGGWVNERHGWRLTFLCMGLPALIIAPLMKMTVAEPRARIGNVPGRARPAKLTVVLNTLWTLPAARHVSLGIVWFFTLTLGLAPWYAAFLTRSHDMETAYIGNWLGVIFGVAGIVGLLLGGYIGGRWFDGNERTQMRVTGVIVAALLPCFCAFLLIPSSNGTLCALAVLMLALNVSAGPTFALLQRLISEEMRATTLSVVMLVANLIGMGLGSQVVGLLSDRLKPVYGNDSLRYAMLTISSVALVSAYHFWQASRTVEQELAANECLGVEVSA
jgi:MFS family permease